MWKDERLYVYEIARELGVSVGTIVAWKKILNLPDRSKEFGHEQNRSDPSLEEIAEMCAEFRKTWPDYRFNNSNIIPQKTGLRNPARFR